ncbi:hypothetical protein [uncultured Fibrobacter sp.]|uniref:hypothetical protein n=1 Tax=uncultured Fibrobacter sp. TaxID=261512 RepID=UPI002638618E|nr:hypothetical protein [uncultured Fibrobacter sp.]
MESEELEKINQTLGLLAEKYDALQRLQRLDVAMKLLDIYNRNLFNASLSAVLNEVDAYADFETESDNWAEIKKTR